MFFFGRFHPLLVHFPIALLLLAFVFEIASSNKRFSQLRYSVMPVLWLGAASAMLSCITGYWLSLEGGYETDALSNHQWAGISTAVVSLIVLWLKYKDAGIQTPVMRRVLIGSFGLLTLMLIIAGHLGAGLTHGEDFLVEHAPWNDESNEFADLVPQVEEIQTAVYYREVVYPILARKCYSCHSSKRQKGDLRLDSEEFLRRGGKSGPLLTAALTDSTMLCKRIMLPVDHKKHMPPNEREQLSSAEIALIQAWVADGASMDKTVQSMSNAGEVVAFWKTFEAMQQRKSWFPERLVPFAREDALADLEEKGMRAWPVAEESPYLEVRSMRSHQTGDDAVEALKAVADQCLVLELDGTNVTDKGLDALSSLRNLRSLHLEHTKVGDDGIRALRSLTELRYLNLVGTNITDSALTILGDLEKLEELYLFQTNVSGRAVAALKSRRSDLQIDTGNYYLPARITDTLIYTQGKRIK